MLVVHAVCVCGHTGTITDRRAVEAREALESFNGRCSVCGRLNQFLALLGWADPVSPTAGGAQIILTSEQPPADKSEE